MLSLFCSTLEFLPDEMLLEICRYLHSGDVLYSFYGLNSRLNQTITFYRQHVSLHRTFYMQFIHIFTNILPQIQYSIRSLVIFELESPLFLQLFQTNYIYYNLEKLTLVNWTDEKLIVFIDTLHRMKYFHKLVIQALDVTESINNSILLKKLLGTNDNQLKELIFDHECDALSLTNDEGCQMIFPHITQLDIELKTTTDLFQLIKIVPNVEKLHITFKHSWTKISSDKQIFSHLKEFSVYAMSWFSTYDDLKTLIQISPTIENLSLVLVTHDYSMIDKQRVFSLLPCSIKNFHYSICYQPSDINEKFDPNEIIRTWETLPIAYSICENDKRIFLHTILYEPSRLSLRSLFNKKMSADFNSEIYRKVRHLHVYDTINLKDTFGIIRHCRQIIDLIISIRTLPTKNHEPQKQTFSLPYLSRLDFLSIQGTLTDSYNIEQILSVAPNLSAISIDFDCLYKLLSDDDQSLYLYYLFHQRIIILCLRFEDTSIDKLTNEHIHCIARIFSRVNHMCIDLRNSDIEIESSTISNILNCFPNLMVLSMYGKLSKNINLNKDDLCQYLVDNSTGRLTSIENFKIDYGNERLKVWM